MILKVTCQICGRIIQEVDNELGDDFPFTPDQVADFMSTAFCEVDGLADINTFFTRGAALSTLEEELAADDATIVTQQDQIDQLTALTATSAATIADLQQQVSDTQFQLDDANMQIVDLNETITNENSQIIALNAQIASLTQQLTDMTNLEAQDEQTISSLETQLNAEIQQDQIDANNAEIYAGALTQQISIMQRAEPVLAQAQAQIYQQPQFAVTVVNLLEELQALLNQSENIATGALGQPSPLVTVGMTQAAWANFQPFLDSLVIPELPPLGGDGTVQMTQDQFSAWGQYIAQDPQFPLS